MKLSDKIRHAIVRIATEGVTEITSRSKMRPHIQDAFAVVEKAYSHVGGHMAVRSAEDLLGEFDVWLLGDSDGDGKPNIVIAAMHTRNGSYKVRVFATDGSDKAKLMFMRMAHDVLKRNDWWAELPDFYAARLHRDGVPMLSDELEVRLLLGGRVGGDFVWHGKHPKKKLEGEGYYSRTYGGSADIRAIVGTVHEAMDRIHQYMGTK